MYSIRVATGYLPKGVAHRNQIEEISESNKDGRSVPRPEEVGYSWVRVGRVSRHATEENDSENNHQQICTSVANGVCLVQ